MKRRFDIGHWDIGHWIVVAGLVLAGATPIADALAHGEKAQEAFLRMRSIHWIDTQIGPIEVTVNDIVEVTGKFVPSENWPGHVPTPEVAFLNIGVPGPSFVRLESWVNGVNMVNSTSFELGGVYDYKVVLKARRPGRYHVHPLINVLDAGPLIGPGIWINVSGRIADFKHEVTTITGETVNLETHNLGTIIGWHSFWMAAGAAWLVYWIFFKGRQLLPRYRRVKELGDDADDMISPFDRKLAVGVMLATLLVVTYGFFSTDARYPNAIPLQTGQIKVEPRPAPDPLVEVKLDDASYRIP
jgi:methane/ammonia monooxygenase subunit B